MVEPDIYCWQWSLSSAGDIHWRSFGDSAVLFNVRNGDTHLVDSIVPHLLKALSNESRKSLQLICDELNGLFHDGIHLSDRVALVFSSLQQLEEMHIVQVFSS
jgi:hypothetical protein